MAKVELRDIRKAFKGGIEALARVDLTVADGEFLTVLGPSGSGKSTLLRLVAGLDAPSSGAISIGGKRAEALAPARRDAAMVFQQPALFPHLSVFENLAFGLRARRASAAEIGPRVGEVAAALGLAECLARRPATLSGGQRQRVALGRAWRDGLRSCCWTSPSRASTPPCAPPSAKTSSATSDGSRSRRSS